MQVAIFQLSLFGINTYVVFDTATGKCAIIDPGMINTREQDAIRQFIEAKTLEVTHIINTHLHIDHSVGNTWAVKTFGAPVLAHKDDEFLGRSLAAQAAAFDVSCQVDNVTIDHYLTEGEEIHIGEGVLKVLHVPGHSPGSVVLYDEKDGFIIAGDVLFAGSVGRADLPGGDRKQLISGIKSKLLTLPDSTVVYPGHGVATTIGREKRFNPYLAS